MVAPISISFCLGESFSRGVSVLSSPVVPLCPSSSRLATLGRGGSGEFRWDYCFCPLGQCLIVRCRIPFPVLGGGGERELLSIIMCSCNPNDSLDHYLIDSFHLCIIAVTVGRMLPCGLDGFADLVYVGLGI